MDTDRGFLVLGDLSGFTSFLTTTELDHGPQITAELLEVVMQQLSAALRIQEVEGDAVFAVGSDGEIGRPDTLRDLLEETFIAFRQRQRDMQVHTTCTCNACRSIPRLSLKLLAHHGSFLRQSVGGRSQVAGTDVILAHRLLKNSVPLASAYLLLTLAAAQQMGVDPAGGGLQPHTETYEHLGEVACLVEDLEPVWQRADAARAARLEPGEAPFTGEVVLPAPPPLAWDYLVTARYRLQYEQPLAGIREERGASGRLGPGTQMHCDHGQFKVQLWFRDWRPYRYYTVDSDTMGVPNRMTVDFSADGNGTRVRWALGVPPGASWLQRLKARVLTPKIHAYYVSNYNRLKEMLADGTFPAAPEESAAR